VGSICFECVEATIHAGEGPGDGGSPPAESAWELGVMWVLTIYTRYPERPSMLSHAAVAGLRVGTSDVGCRTLPAGGAGRGVAGYPGL
jgi:hypothetical protein